MVNGQNGKNEKMEKNEEIKMNKQTNERTNTIEQTNDELAKHKWVIALHISNEWSGDGEVVIDDCDFVASNQD